MRDSAGAKFRMHLGKHFVQAPGEHAGRIVRLAASCRQLRFEREIDGFDVGVGGHRAILAHRTARNFGYTKVAPGGINPNRHQT